MDTEDKELLDQLDKVDKAINLRNSLIYSRLDKIRETAADPKTPSKDAQALKEYADAMDTIMDLFKAAKEEGNFEEARRQLKEAGEAMLRLFHILESPDFLKIRAGKLSQDISHTVTTRKTKANEDGKATVRKGDIIGEFESFGTVKGISTKDQQLRLLIDKNADKDGVFYIPIEEYMTWRRLDNKKSAEREAKTSLDRIFHADYTVLEADGGSWDMRILEGKKNNTVEKGYIKGLLTRTYNAQLKKQKPMDIPPQLGYIDTRYNANAFHILFKLSSLKYQNWGQERADYTAVIILLDVSEIPSYEEVQTTGGRHTYDRIIKPLCDALDELKDTLTWELVRRIDDRKPLSKENTQALTQEEIRALDYPTFRGLYVHTTWKWYPDQSKRLEAKADKNKERAQITANAKEYTKAKMAEKAKKKRTKK